MVYTKQLPPVRELLGLAQDAKFPMRSSEIAALAVRHGFSEQVVDFLRLFSPETIFKSRADFMIRCEELELLIGQERSSPMENIRSQQD